MFRELKESEIDTAWALVWRVFLEFEAPDYTVQGVDEFYRSCCNPEYLARLRWYGAFDRERLIGVIATRNSGNHVALFFVDGWYHRKGIGRRLLELALKDNTAGKMTVNSSPFAVSVYHCLGFRDTDTEQVMNGLRYTPMELEFPVSALDEDD